MAGIPRLNGAIRALEQGKPAFTAFAAPEISVAQAINAAPCDAVVFELEHNPYRPSMKFSPSASSTKRLAAILTWAPKTGRGSGQGFPRWLMAGPTQLFGALEKGLKSSGGVQA